MIILSMISTDLFQIGITLFGIITAVASLILGLTKIFEGKKNETMKNVHQKTKSQIKDSPKQEGKETERNEPPFETSYNEIETEFPHKITRNPNFLKKYFGIPELNNFESEHLSNYYSQVLYQSKVSFWFSLIFASLGFLIIILSIFLYSEGNFDKSALSLISGLLIDGVSALFFVQSNKAQKAMGEFFQKLRIDKNNLEARKLCELIEDKQLKDSTKAQIVLKLAEINIVKN